MAYLKLNGLRFHVQRLAPQDAGPPAATVVLLHGLLTDSLASYYFTLAPTLVAAGMEVLLYDQRGHGRTGQPPTGYQLERFVDDLECLLDRLELTGPVHLLGNSFGGTAAFGLATRRPDQVAGLLVIESEPATSAWSVKMDANLRRAKTQLVREEALAWIATRYSEHTARLARSAGRLLAATSLARDLPASRIPTEAELRAIRCPVLAVYGKESDMVSQAAWLEGLLPDCRSTFVSGQEHSVLIGATEAVRRLTLSWLRQHGSEPRGVAAERLPTRIRDGRSEPEGSVR
ncbi:alpha/beta fold hydrolase [Streptantibioticus ferralitis]|uniref:Alpha/beta hydrolase n=1 Tax=Streptantibioticus ferralitis TaxID=236510 RepID=A0ABT5YUB5_9ACTN|nr:alpha/beta hydrolase [Streptantibioticus ferralitis]MDF2255199.1 alpha/beta hydrolase [Streptantibioticus ferralitis]